MTTAVQRRRDIEVGDHSRDAAHVRGHLRSLLQFCGILTALWLTLFSIDKSLPYVRSGADAIYRAKLQQLTQGLDADLVIFGNSKVLSGFIPAIFDSMCHVSSYNLGLPDEERFITNLEQLVSSGRAPRFVLLTITRSKPTQPASVFHYLNEDRTIVDRLFPFRHLPRDLTLFLLRSQTRGGPVAFYQKSEGTVAQMQADRGYYFIEGQSHHPANRIPPDFRLVTDTPATVKARPAISESDLDRLHSLAERRGMQIWIVPSYFRPGEYAPAPVENRELAVVSRTNSRIHVAGPDYWTLPLEYFADGAHLNPTGAAEYTRRLAELLSPAIRQ